MTEMTGRCLCGAVQWAYDGPVHWAGHCHCQSCRAATGAAFTSFFGVTRNQVRWQGEMGAAVTSNGAVVRKFCTACGSQMTCQIRKWPTEAHLYAATLDDPSLFKPLAHFHWAERLDWVEMTDDLPRYAGSAEGAEPIT